MAAAAGSVAVGLSLGWLYARLFARIKEIATAILTQFLGVFLVWIFAEKLGLSGIITVVCYALIIARISPARTPARLRIPSYAVWEVVVFVLNILVFILVGLQLKPLLQRLHQEEGNLYLVAGGIVCVTAITIRIAWVMSYNTFVRLKNRWFGAHLSRPMMLPSVASGLIISWCGMRGLVTLAAALALPDGHDGAPPFPYRDLLLFCAFCVVIGTLVIQGLTLRPLMLALGLKDDGEVDREVRHARATAAQAALQAIENEPCSDERAAVDREYQTRLQNVNEQQTTGETGQPQASELVRLQRNAMAAERRVLAELRARDEIGDDAFHQLEEELDWAEVHLRGGGF